MRAHLGIGDVESPAPKKNTARTIVAEMLEHRPKFLPEDGGTFCGGCMRTSAIIVFSRWPLA